MSSLSENVVLSGNRLERRADGTTLATFSSPSAAAHAANMWREGHRTSARWSHPGQTTPADRTAFDALPLRP